MNIQKSIENNSRTWHLWVIGILFLFIYSIGAYDFYMVQISDINYLNSVNTNIHALGYFTDYPFAYQILWVINIIGGLAASLLLLFRSKYVVYVSLIGAISLVTLDTLTFAFRNRWDVFGSLTSIIDLIVLIVTIGFFFYSKKIVKQNIIK